jgi:hypothetical protein
MEGDQQPRRTERQNAGKHPARYGGFQWDYRPTAEDSIDPNGRERPSTSHMLSAPSSTSTPLNILRRQRAMSVSSRTSNRTDSTIREKETEVKLYKELADIEEQETQLKLASLQRQKELAQWQADLELSRIQSEEQQFSESEDERSPPHTFMYTGEERSPQKSGYWVNPSPYNGSNSRLDKQYDGSEGSECGAWGVYGRHAYGPPSYRSRASSLEELKGLGACKRQPLHQLGVTELVEALKTAFPRNDDKMANILAHQSVAKDLPEFNGNPSEWPRFITRFKETNKLFEYSDEENLSRLSKALKGKAKDVAKTHDQLKKRT